MHTCIYAMYTSLLEQILFLNYFMGAYQIQSKNKVSLLVGLHDSEMSPWIHAEVPQWS